MRTKILAGLAATAAVLAVAAPAFAGTASGNPTTGLVDGQAVTVTWSGFSAGASLFISQCGVSVINPIFTPSGYCNGDTQQLGSGASGTAVINVYAGNDPAGLAFACGTTTDPVNQPLRQADGSCFIRVTELSNENTTGQAEFPITFATTNPVVPEAPYAVLLPLGAIGALGAGLILNRRKSIA